MTPATLHAWAARHAIPAAAMADLLATLGLGAPAPPPPTAPDSALEDWTQSVVRLEAARLGIYLWRNNVGALKDNRGVPVRYGLANDNSKMNEVLKSGDLIGIRPVVITPAMIGATFGQFVSRECKRPGWKYAGTPREEAQSAWVGLISRLGGDARFAAGEGSFP